MYGALPKVLDANPFAEVNESSETLVRGTGHVTAIYDAALGLTRKYGVHPAIESQLFAYLFFFTNVSLFNTLMENGKILSRLPQFLFNKYENDFYYFQTQSINIIDGIKVYK